MNERNNRYERRYSDRARAATKAKAKKQNLIIASTAIVLVAAVAASFMIFGAFKAKPQTADAAPTTAVVKVADKDLAAQKSAQPATAAPIAQPAAQPAAVQQTAQPAAVQQTAAQPAAVQQTVTPAAEQATAQQTQQAQQSEDRIDNINGERVYIDTKRTAPEGAGTPAHFYANGKTSYGFDWTYDTDNCNFKVACNYNFDQQQYDFILYGVTPGVSHITLYYNTDDNVQVPANITINVDENLNVTLM